MFHFRSCISAIKRKGEILIFSGMVSHNKGTLEGPLCIVSLRHHKAPHCYSVHTFQYIELLPSLNRKLPALGMPHTTDNPSLVSLWPMVATGNKGIVLSALV